MTQITLPRNPVNVVANADEHGVSIFLGWTVGILKQHAISYVQSYNTSADQGFFEINDSVVLSHGPAKLTISKQEAAAIISLIKSAYGVG